MKRFRGKNEIKIIKAGTSSNSILSRNMRDIKIQKVDNREFASLLQVSNLDTNRFKRAKLNNGRITQILSDNSKFSLLQATPSTTKYNIENLNEIEDHSTISISNDVITTVKNPKMPDFTNTKVADSEMISIESLDEDYHMEKSSEIPEEEMITVDGALIDEDEFADEYITEVIGTPSTTMDPLLIKSEPNETSESTIQIKIDSNASVPSTSNENPVNDNSSSKLLKATKQNLKTKESKSLRIDKNDPRSRMHYIKYMKKDGKTVKMFECGICWKEFVHQYELMRHLPIHTDERNFQCNQCGKAFRQMSTLSQHKATHSQSRPYVCDVCQKRFSRVSTLISHKKIHSDQKQHICPICKKAFHQKGNLKNHLFTHTNERPYKCDICGRGFNQSSNLQCHKSKAHNDRSSDEYFCWDKFKCKNCGEGFARRSMLRQHIYLAHGVNAYPEAKDNSETNLDKDGPILKKKKIGNVRIIQLPNGDKTFHEVPHENLKRNPPVKQNPKTGILIDPIDTTAMHEALAAGRIPFALLKPNKGVPVVVKVQFAAGSKHMLVPATADELRSAGMFTITNNKNGPKAVQIKVPVVAAINQTVDENGLVHMEIEAPDEEENINKENLATDPKPVVSTQPTVTTTTTEQEEFVINPSFLRPSISEPLMECEEDDQSLQMPILQDSLAIPNTEEPNDYAAEQTDKETPVSESEPPDPHEDLMPPTIQIPNETETIKDGLVNVEGLQYLKQSSSSEGKFDEYEMVAPNDPQATHIINQQGQITPIKVEDAGAVTMNQEHISALMDALQSAGYQISGGANAVDNHQIIISAEGDAVIVDNRPVQMVIDNNMQAVVGSENIVDSMNLVVHKVPDT